MCLKTSMGQRWSNPTIVPILRPYSPHSASAATFSSTTLKSPGCVPRISNLGRFQSRMGEPFVKGFKSRFHSPPRDQRKICAEGLILHMLFIQHLSNFRRLILDWFWCNFRWLLHHFPDIRQFSQAQEWYAAGEPWTAWQNPKKSEFHQIGGSHKSGYP